jgi:ribonuclease HI
MPWIKHRLRDVDVWARIDAAGALVTDRDGRVEIVYKPAAGAKVYRAGARNLSTVAGTSPLDFEAGEPAPEKQAKATTRTSRPPVKPVEDRAVVTPGAPSAASPADSSSDAVQVWTDGACSGNPGPAGAGVVIIDGKERVELSEYLGTATNQIAELEAILRGLRAIEDRSRPVVVYSDSAYSIGLLTANPPWKAKKNVELVAELRELVRAFADLRFVKVPGHAGVPLNERCDQLARDAIARGR